MDVHIFICVALYGNWKMFACTLNVTRLVAIPLPCEQQFNISPSWENTFFHTLQLSCDGQVHGTAKRCHRSTVKSEIISDMLKPVRWKAFHVIEFFLIFQRTLSLMIKCNLTENCHNSSYTGYRKEDTLYNGINTNKRWWEKKKRIVFILRLELASELMLCTRLDTDHGHTSGEMILCNISFSSRSKMLSKSLFRTSRIHLCTRIILQWLEQYTGPDPFSIGSNRLSFDFKK